MAQRLRVALRRLFFMLRFVAGQATCHLPFWRSSGKTSWRTIPLANVIVNAPDGVENIRSDVVQPATRFAEAIEFNSQQTAVTRDRGAFGSKWRRKESDMQISELTMFTPYYVLIDQKSPLCARVADPHLAVEYSAIFGFSDKSTYDTFNRASTVPLRPYPLVKGYLQSQLDEASAEGADERCIKLVILNASGPHETNVHAATLSAVLEARESGVKQLTATHYLTFNPASDAYRLEA